MLDICMSILCNLYNCIVLDICDLYSCIVLDICNLYNCMVLDYIQKGGSMLRTLIVRSVHFNI